MVGIQMESKDISIIYQMQKVRDSQSSQEIELRDTNATSPSSLVAEETQNLPSQGMWKCYWKRCTFLLVLMICATMLSFEINAQGSEQQVNKQSIIDEGSFAFLAYCPISYFNETTSFRAPPKSVLDDELEDELRRRMLLEVYKNRIEVDPKDQDNYDPNRTYIIEVRSLNYDLIDPNGTVTPTPQLFYCGLLRDFYDVCNNSFVGCSSPGPLFDIPTREFIDIIWVNEFDPTVLPPTGGTCMQAGFQPDTLDADQINYCTLMNKINRSQTYIDPTNFTLSTPLDHMLITPDNWPMTTHLHGAEIRPTFDGNPISWITNGDYDQGKVGVATFSLEESCYYDSFDKLDENNETYDPPKIFLRDVTTGKRIQNFKINRYPNRQNPGSMWYHDHAMHLTSYNVQYGLSGFYILRDQLVEQEIGIAHQNEKIVMLANNQSFYPSFNLTGFQAGVVYRFKFLNNYFADGPDMVLRISFSYNDCNDSISQREIFSIIGADSSLFDISIDNQLNFVLAQAERLELLIKFNEKQSQFAICSEAIDNEYFPTPPPTANSPHSSQVSIPKGISGIKISPPSGKSKNNRTTIDNVVLSVPFTNLSLQTDIAVKRMRPLIFVGGAIFTIHGRTDFHKGWSENPTLGTTEDWFIINTIYFSHPIHVHLLNFEVIREYYQRYIIPPNQGNSGGFCALYELDFLLAAINITKNDPALQPYIQNMTLENGKIDLNYLCNNRYSIESLPSIINSLMLVFPEYEVDPVTKVSGIDVLTKLTEDEKQYYSSYNIQPPIDPTDPSPYKYVFDDGHPSPKPYYARWKDTAYNLPFTVLQYRIRWTKSNYTEADKAAGTYFHVPNDQLREYPGYVYHCHILPHEDNEMMRPIMVQLPKQAKLNTSTPCNYNPETKQKVLQWKDKYNCVNKLCGNKPT